MDLNAKDEYAGATINILVRGDPKTFLTDNPEYDGKPYVIVPFLGRRFCEEVADGQLIFCTDSSSSVKSTEEDGTGTVGYWIPEEGRANTFLGITAFHVLDYITTYSGLDREFSSHESNCRNGVLKNTGRYELDEEDGEYTCTYVDGLYDNSLDVGVIRCTEQRRENQPDSEAYRGSFQWPRLLYEIVVEKEIELGDILMEYEIKHLKGRKLSIFHNGKSSKNDRKVGVLCNRMPSETLGVDDKDHPIIIGDVIAVEPAIDEEVPLNLELLEGIYVKYYESLVEESESSSGSSGDERVSSGVDESPAAVEEEDLYPCDDKHKVPSKDKGSSPDEESMTIPEGDIVNGAASARDVRNTVEDTTGVEEDDYIQFSSRDSDKKANKNEFDSGIEDDATQRFAHGGDSGCVYYLLIEKDGQPLKAPIGIHRGSCKDIASDGKRISCGSPIGIALKKMKELHGLDVWFPIVD